MGIMDCIACVMRMCLASVCGFWGEIQGFTKGIIYLHAKSLGTINVCSVFLFYDILLSKRVLKGIGVSRPDDQKGENSFQDIG